MDLALAFDLVMVVLLLATIFYCASLQRRLGAVRGVQAEMRALADRLGDSALRAETGVGSLRAAAGEAAAQIEPRLEQAKTLVGDLDMLCHRAGKLADNLASGTAPQQRKTPPPVAAARPARAKKKASARQPSRSERELIEALKASR